MFLRDDEEMARGIRAEVVAGRFPAWMQSVRVEVYDGGATFSCHVPETSLVPLAARPVRAGEGVVDVHRALSAPHRRPVLDPDFPDDGELRRPPQAPGGR